MFSKQIVNSRAAWGVLSVIFLLQIQTVHGNVGDGQVLTVDGQPCVFPFIYNSFIYTECADIDGVLSCQLEDFSFAPCEIGVESLAEPAVNFEEEEEKIIPDTIFSADGRPCIFPYTYNGQQFNECFDVDTQLSCAVAEGVFARCVDSTNVAIPSEQVPPPIPEDSTNRTISTSPSLEVQLQGDRVYKTVNNNHCRFPFTYQGKIYENECAQDVDNPQQTICLTVEDGTFDVCSILEQPATNNENTKSDGKNALLIALLVVLAFLVMLIVIAAIFYIKRNKTGNKFQLFEEKDDKQQDADQNIGSSSSGKLEQVQEKQIELQTMESTEIEANMDSEIDTSLSESEEKGPAVQRKKANAKVVINVV